MISKEEKQQASLRFSNSHYKGGKDGHSIFNRAIYRRCFEAGVDHANAALLEIAKIDPDSAPTIRAIALNSILKAVESDGGKFATYKGKLEEKTVAILHKLGVHCAYDWNSKLYTLERK